MAFARPFVDAWIERARGRERGEEAFRAVMKRFLTIYDVPRPAGGLAPSIAAFMQVSEGWLHQEIRDGHGEESRRWLGEGPAGSSGRRLGLEEGKGGRGA